MPKIFGVSEKKDASFVRVDRITTKVKINKKLIYINCVHTESANLK